MSRLTKSLGLLVSGLLLLVMIALMLFSLVDAYLPTSFDFLRGLLGFETFYRSYLATVLFWVAAILAILLVLFMLVFAFYPKTKTDYSLVNKDGHLSLYDTAIEGLVSSVVTSQGYMDKPKVKAKLYPNKIDIAIKGELREKGAIFDRTESLKSEVVHVLQEFVGLEKPMRFAVAVDHIQSESQAFAKKSRVE